jgi:hypothetical protein
MIAVQSGSIDDEEHGRVDVADQSSAARILPGQPVIVRVVSESRARGRFDMVISDHFLHRQFGPSYVNYRRRVRNWLRTRPPA